MKYEKIYDAISDVREEFIEEAECFIFKKKRAGRLLKWGSLAACFCLVVLGTSLAMSGVFARKGTVMEESGGGNTPTPVSGLKTVLAYNGALYNVSNELNILNIAGIPDAMTKEDCGTSLGNLIKTEQGYEETIDDTDVELYQYAPAYSNSAVYVIRDGEEYMAGLFSNNLVVGDRNDYSPISELYRRYGIESEEHISAVSFYSGQWSNNSPLESTEKVILERKALDAFYEATMSMEMECYSREDYLNKLLEEDPMTLADSTLSPAKTICITTAEGLKFYLNWAEENGWIFSSGASAYYKITGEMQAWLEEYILQK